MTSNEFFNDNPRETVHIAKIVEVDLMIKEEMIDTRRCRFTNN